MTTLDASLLTGFLTGFFALAGAFATHRLQRTAAQDERMWNRRAETYVSLLQYHGSGMVEGAIEAATDPEWAVRDELTAKATAFASDEVLGLWQKSALANLVVEQYVGEEWPELTAGAGWQAVEDATEKDPELRRLRRAEPASTPHEQPSPHRAGINGKTTSGNPAGPTSMTARSPVFCHLNPSYVGVSLEKGT